jgi:uncharacterized membrane protein
MSHLRGGFRTSLPTDQETRYRTSTNDLDWAEEQARHAQPNVGDIERMISTLIGGGVLLRSALRPSWRSALAALLGAALLHRGLTGYCPGYARLGLDTSDPHAGKSGDTSLLGRRKVRTNRAVKISQAITVGRPLGDVYHFWRNLENLPKVMSHVRSVEVVNNQLSHWVIETLPGAPSVEWDAEIINEVEDDRIGWRTLRGSDIDHAGSVEFEPVEDGGTRVTVTLQYDPPAGPIGAAVASLLGQDPAKKISSDLQHFKELMESETSPSR